MLRAVTEHVNGLAHNVSGTDCVSHAGPWTSLQCKLLEADVLWAPPQRTAGLSRMLDRLEYVNFISLEFVKFTTINADN